MQFWMKNTWTSLDIVFIAGKEDHRVHRRVKPSPRKPPTKRSRALAARPILARMPAGTADKQQLKEGEAFRFEVPIPGP